MKQLFTRILFVLSTFVLFFALPAKAAPEKYTFDPAHSYILWHVNHMGFSTLSGKWLAEGTLELDEDKPQNRKVNVTFKMADLMTAIPKLDEHLKGKDFFDVAQFPTAAFVSDKIIRLGNNAKIQGVLTIHGVSKPVTLKIKLNKIGMSPISKKKTAGFSGSTTIKRSDFGVGKYTPDVGDNVKIDIEAEANKAD